MVGPMWVDLVQWAECYMLKTTVPMADATDFLIPQCVDDFAEAVAILKQAQATWHQDC
ncbi:MAG: hypothetical protein ABG776_11940 [Cyanobacteria bacterium J06555_13]